MARSSIAILFANRVINGDITYAEVPAKLKSAVSAELRAAGCDSFITD